MKKNPLVRVAVEALMIVVAATVLGLGYNAIRANGLSLSRDFGGRQVIRPPDGPPGNDPPPPISNGDPPPAETLEGFLVLTTDTLLEQLSELGDVTTLVDARSRSKYVENHIPGAVYLNYYQSEKLIEGLRSRLEESIFVVVYCDGGDCEDSLLLANYLTVDVGLPPDVIQIYKSGLNDWVARDLPVLAGEEPGEVPTDLPVPAESAPGEDGVQQPGDGSETTDETPETPEPTDDTSPPDHGMQTATMDDVVMYSQDLADETALLDARSRRKYEDGHLPGAYYANHYQSEKLLPDLQEQLEAASFVVVYCDGGDCEDSIQLSSDLIEIYGVEYDKIYLFEEGYEAWVKAGHDVVKGAERGGQ